MTSTLHADRRALTSAVVHLVLVRSMRRVIPIVVVGSFLPFHAIAGDRPNLPQAANSTAEIVDSFKMQSGYGEPFSVSLRDGDRYLFVTWDCPFSGLDLNFVFAYFYDGSAWHQFYSGSVRAVPPLVSPTVDAKTHELVLHGRAESISVRVPLSTVPSASTVPKT